MVTLADIQKNEDIKALISAGNRYLAAMGFTEHGPRHVSYVSRTAAGILAALNFSPREVELAAIAGWVHDVGNSVNRHDHGPLGAVLLLPMILGVNGIWFAMTAAEILTLAFTVTFLLTHRKKYNY